MRIPKTGNILIPRIREKIEWKLRELNLEAEVSPSNFLKINKFSKHRYFSPCLTKKNKKIVFYARLHNNLDAKEKFIREIEFLTRLKRSNLKIKRVIPEIIDYGIEKDFEWFEREYSQFRTLGSSRNISFIPSTAIFSRLGKLIFEISEIPYQKLEIRLKKFNCRHYLSPEVYGNFVKRKIISPELSKRTWKMIKEAVPLLEKENHYFSHGDLNLGNVLSDGKDLFIIDWELTHLNNFAYDIGYLWAHLWEAKRGIRKKLMESYLKNLSFRKLVKFKKLLPIVVSYLSLGGIELKKEGERKRFLEKRRNFYLKLLENCTKNFDILIAT